MERLTGIIGAMEMEVEGLRARMEAVREKRAAGLAFTLGRLNGKDVVLCRCGPGKVNAAVSAQAMITLFHPARVINSGIAGGLGDGVGLADLVVADRVCQHDMDTTALGDEPGFVSGVGRIYFPCDPELVSAMVQAAKSNRDRVHTGVVASGDQFIASREERERIAGRFSALAVEMEGGSIGQVCHMNGVPFGILRCISDSAGGGAVMEYPALCREAAQKSIRVLTDVLSALA